MFPILFIDDEPSYLKNLLTESLVVGALVFYLAMALAAQVGLASCIFGEQEML